MISVGDLVRITKPPSQDYLKGWPGNAACHTYHYELGGIYKVFSVDRYNGALGGVSLYMQDHTNDWFHPEEGSVELVFSL